MWDLRRLGMIGTMPRREDRASPGAGSQGGGRAGADRLHVPAFSRQPREGRRRKAEPGSDCSAGRTRADWPQASSVEEIHIVGQAIWVSRKL